MKMAPPYENGPPLLGLGSRTRGAISIIRPKAGKISGFLVENSAEIVFLARKIDVLKCKTAIFFRLRRAMIIKNEF